MLTAALIEAADALRAIEDYFEAEYREGEKPYQAAIVAHAALAALDRLVALLDSERQAREKAERERDERLTEDESRTLAFKYDAAVAARDRLAEALREIADMPGPGLSGTGAGGWTNTLQAPAIARDALAAAGSGGNTQEKIVVRADPDLMEWPELSERKQEKLRQKIRDQQTGSGGNTESERR